MAVRWPKIPIWLIYALVIAIPLSWVPLAMIAYVRAVPSRLPRVHIFQDMDNQPRLNPQATSPVDPSRNGQTIFADRRAMRPRIDGTIARGELRTDTHYEFGKVLKDGQWQWADTFPEQIKVDEWLVERGRERFNIYCSACHGESGYGEGMVHVRAMKLETPGWVQPASLHTDEIRGRELGNLYNTIKWGVRTMPGYGSQIPTEDRWTIVAYVKALQLSQHAEVKDVPEDRRASLRSGG